MSHPLLQLWGGLFYLLNKVFFSWKERSHTERQSKFWRVWSWIVYIIGLPAWVIILVMERNWIAAALEAGGLPAMALGLIIALRGKGETPKWLDRTAIAAIIFGLGYSLYDYGGLNTPNQVCELGIVIGFLIGTYLLAKDHLTGYLWMMLMNISAGALMYIEHYPWLVAQQAVSLAFIADAYIIRKRKTAQSARPG